MGRFVLSEIGHLNMNSKIYSNVPSDQWKKLKIKLNYVNSYLIYQL